MPTLSYRNRLRYIGFVALHTHTHTHTQTHTYTERERERERERDASTHAHTHARAHARLAPALSGPRETAPHRVYAQFGRHALDADDDAWTHPRYQRDLLLLKSGRDIGRVGPKAGPLEADLFAPHLLRILGRGYQLRSITGSGTDAVRSFWDIADAHAPGGLQPAQLLLLEGSYLGGSGALQSVSGLGFLRSRAFAASAAQRLRPYVVEAPYRRVDFDDFNDFDDSDGLRRPSTDCDGLGALGGRAPPTLEPDAYERCCLEALAARLAALRADGVTVAGVVVEFVRAHDGLALSPAYVRQLGAWAAAERLLLFEDAVLLGLRCGRPFASCLYPPGTIQMHWIAIGKLYGFSGVVQHVGADHYGALLHVDLPLHRRRGWPTVGSQTRGSPALWPPPSGAAPSSPPCA